MGGVAAARAHVGVAGARAAHPASILSSQLLPGASKIKRKKVSSTPEVSGTRHKPGPDASDFSSAIDLGTCLHRSRVPDF